jgi:hypothetical protein
MPISDLSGGELVLLPVAPRVQAQRILRVELRAADGRSWNAIGGGDTVEAAIEWASESCPGGTSWHAVAWTDLYSE